MSKYATHQNFLKEVLLWISVNRKKWRIWQNATGAGYAVGNHQFMKFGLVGSSDILGLDQNGRFLAIEIKTGKSVLSKQQKRFKEMVENQNGFYFLVRDSFKIEDQL